MPPSHPQIAQGKQVRQTRRVLCNAAIAHLRVPELLLDHTERMFDLGSRAGLESLDLLQQPIGLVPGIQRLALARPEPNELTGDSMAASAFSPRSQNRDVDVSNRCNVPTDTLWRLQADLGRSVA